MISVTLALAGLLMSIYLVMWKSGMLGALACGTGGCETVQLSKWGELLGIPVAAYGVAGYLAMMIVGILGIQPGREKDTRTALALLMLSSGGVAFTLYLSYLEAFVIHAWCRWCLGSATIIGLMFLISLVDWLHCRRATE